MVKFGLKNNKIENEFTSFEAEALSCALEMAAIQFYILNVGTFSSSSFHFNNILRKKIWYIIEKVITEIRETKTFDFLCQHVKKEIENEKIKINLPSEIVRNRQKIEDLGLKLLELQISKSEEIIKMQQTVATLKDRIHEEASWSSVKLKFTDRWETARQSQNQLKCQIATRELVQKHEELVNKSKNEIRVHQELSNFIVSQQKELENELSHWIEKYEKEKKNKNEKLKHLLTKRKERQILIRNLKQLYEERKREIDEYLYLKKIIQQEKEREELINNMAMVIQAWWRGTMVRKGLGLFKKKKKWDRKKKN